MRKVIYTFIFSAFLTKLGFSQSKAEPTNKSKIAEVKTMVVCWEYQGEKLPTITLKNVDIVTQRIFKNEKDKLAYLKLKRDVRKAYPYAVLASIKLKEYDAILANTPQNLSGPYLKKTEKEILTQFGGDLKNLTMKQGRILVRLIDRETGKSSYKLIREYRGTLSAFMWQSLAILFSNNLNSKYDPSKGEDKLIEEIIQQIHDGTV